MIPPNRPPSPMPFDLGIALADLTPDRARLLLAQAQIAYFNLLTGQMPSAVETPQLGKVAFWQPTAADMQRLIDYLNAVVASGGSTSFGMSGMKVRKPFSFFGTP